MLEPNIGNIVSTAWVSAMNAKPFIVKLVTKDGRWFKTWIRHAGTQLEQPVFYKSGRFRYAIFDPERHYDEVIWRQRKGRGQPRLDFTPDDWVPLEFATAKRMKALRPPNDIFSSKSLLSLLK